MSLKIGAFNSNYRCECPNINEGFVFFGWRILFSDLAVLQNATRLSCLQVWASGGSTSERRYAVSGYGRTMAAYSNSAANCGAVKLPSGAGSVASRFANGVMPCASCRCSRIRADNGLHMATALQIAALLSGSRGGQRDG